jgi:dihydrofolate synthase/folylpolyglutamate synthase
VSDEAELRAYAGAMRRLLGRGGYERTGDPAEARRFRIDHVSAYLDAHGRPDRRHTVHVAGSKGKGSTAAIVESILRAAGAHTLLLTSPDLHSARERVAIDGAPLGHAAFAAIVERLLADEAVRGWSYFELLTVLGWIAGAEAGCDWQVLEVGLGGRLDTTNAVVAKHVAVITPIDLEHTAILGDTLAQIAREKAGIVRGPCAVVTAPMRASALESIREAVAAAGATLHEVPAECALRVTRQTLEGQTLDLRTPLRTYRGLRLPLPGAHQAENAATAVRAAELAWAAAGCELPARAVAEGLASVRWPGRFEVVPGRPLVVLDGLHTPLAAERFAEAARAVRLPRPLVYVVGLLAGKDTAAIAKALGVEGAQVVVVRPASGRAAEPAAVAEAFREAGADVQQAGDVAAGLQLGRALAGERGCVVVAGSLYTVSEARELLLGIAGDRALGLR